MRPVRVLAACVLTGQLLCAGEGEFKDIVHSISREYNTRPIHIPLFGLVNVFLFTVRPAGARHLDVAVFENLDTNHFPGRDFQMVLNNATAGWAPFVRVTSHRKGAWEQTFIYMRQDGKNCRLLLTALEPKEATVIHIKLNPDAVQRWLNEPHRSAQARGHID